MKLTDIPPEVRNWLLSNHENYSIFVNGPYRRLSLVTGDNLPQVLWEKFKTGKLKAYLDAVHYQEKENADETQFLVNRMVEDLLGIDMEEDAFEALGNVQGQE